MSRAKDASLAVTLLFQTMTSACFDTALEPVGLRDAEDDVEAGAEVDVDHDAVEDGIGDDFAGPDESLEESIQDVVTEEPEVPLCGNGIPEEGEECDGTDLRGETCQSLVHFEGTLACDGRCRYDVSGCPGCGNGLCEPAEDQHICPADCGAVAVSAGQSHTCALLADGTVRCWGEYVSWIDEETPISSNVPVTVSGIEGAIAISAGVWYTCAVLSDGTARCWGDNSSGQLGDGTTTNSSVPVAVSGLAGSVDVTAGETWESGFETVVSLPHTCALLSDGTVQCWGSNFHGDLGDGTTSDGSSVPVPVFGFTDAMSVSSGSMTCALSSGRTVACWGGSYGNVPVAVPDLGDAVDVSVGYERICAVTSDGTVECWQPGGSPAPVPGLSGSARISVGGFLSCVRSPCYGPFFHACALLLDGTVMCWGANYSGQLGDGTYVDSDVPVVAGGLTGVVSVSAGAAHTCAALSDGTVWCWGGNGYGQLGDGTATDSNVPVEVESFATWCGNGILDPQAGEECDGDDLGSTTCESFGYDLGALACDSTCRFDESNCSHCGDRVCEDSENEGNCPFDCLIECGNGMCQAGEDQFACPGDCRAVAVSAGYEYTCALLSDGSLRYWCPSWPWDTLPSAVLGVTSSVFFSVGSDFFSRTCAVLSDGTVTCWNYRCCDTPEEDLTGLRGVVSVSVGNDHTCAALSDGTAMCWRGNASGQLGDGTNTNSSVPTAVFGLTGVAGIEAGYGSTCALLSDGTARCWGDNAYGQLGDGTGDDSNVPVTVSELTGAVAITAAYFHACAVLSDGEARCWGSNQYGQLGDGTNISSNVPVAVSELTGAVAVSVGGNHTCALLSDGTIRCWGGNWEGQIGDGTTTASNVPLPVSFLTGAVAVSAGDTHTCALLSDGTAWCWGGNGNIPEQVAAW